MLHAASDHPNVILIVVDDMGWKDTGCYGSKFYQTPTIDRLAAEGVRFTNFYAPGPVCSPSRAAILTGRSPARLGITNVTQVKDRQPRPTDRLVEPHKKNSLPLEEITLPEVLAQNGYVSGAFGKWHLGEDPFNSAAQGFTFSVAGRNEGNINYFDPYKVKSFPSRKPGEYITDRLTDEVVQFIEAQQTKPFFVYLAHFAVHIPLQAPAELIAKYQKQIIPGDPQNNPTYAAAIERIDQSLATILAKLQELKLDRKTIVFFTSDNGAMEEDIRPPFEHITSNAPLREGKSTLYEGGIREPLIAWWPGHLPASAVCDEPVIGTDFLPTIAALTASALDQKVALDGQDISHFLKEPQATSLNRPLFWHFPHYTYQPPCAAMRKGPWKLVKYFGDERCELYNLEEDLSEKKDLSTTEPARSESMKGELDAWLQQSSALLPRPNPSYDPAASKTPKPASTSE